MAKDSVVDPEARDKYLLQVTAGPTYNPPTHQEVRVNSETPTHFESPLISCWLQVRIKNYHGLPPNSPSTSPYFTHPQHASDRYSVSFSFVPKTSIPGPNLVLGFDYDHSIKHQLPPGFKYAMKIATTMLDPGLYSDPYSDNPYLYGPALSGFFALNVGSLVDDIPASEQLAQLAREAEGVVKEGATGTGDAVRTELGMPSAWKKRRKFFLNEQNLESFTLEKGRMYHADFFNPHLDFAEFALRLPGIKIGVAKYVDEKTHHLRFVLKDRTTGETAFVVIFRLLFGEELEGVVRERGDGGRGEGGEKEDVKDVRWEAVSGEERHASRVQEKEKDESEEEGDEGVVTSLANSIYAAFAAMGLRDESSSEEDEEGKDASPTHPSETRESVNAQVDNMSNATVEKYLQTQNSNI